MINKEILRTENPWKKFTPKISQDNHMSQKNNSDASMVATPSGSFNNSQIQDKIRLNLPCEYCNKVIYIGNGTIIEGKPLHFECYKNLALSKNEKTMENLQIQIADCNDGLLKYEKQLSQKDEVIEDILKEQKELRNDLKQKLLEKINKMKGIKVNSIPVRKDDGEFISKDELLSKIKEMKI